MSQAPSVGRAVHYVARGSADGVFPKACRAATVTEVGVVETRNGANEVLTSYPDTRVGLAVLNPTGMFFHSLAAGGCAYDDGNGKTNGALCDGGDHEGGSWHWPARV